MSTFNVPDQLLYSEPQRSVVGSTSFVEFQPESGQIFNSSQNMKIRLTSPNKFLDTQRSYLLYDLSLVNTSTNSNVTTTLGGASVIGSVRTYVAGAVVEYIQNYPLMLSGLYASASTTRQAALKALEGYGATGQFSSAKTSSPSSPSTSAQRVYHALQTGMLSGTNQLIPLSFLAGGIELEINLNNINNVTNTADATDFVVSNVRFVACMIKPDDSYLSSFQESLSKGSVAKMPIQLTRNFSVNTNASTTQDQTLYVNFLNSVNSLLGIHRVAADINSNTTDAYGNNTLEGLASYYLMVGTERYPLNRAIECNSSLNQIENIVQALASLDITFNEFNVPNLTNQNYIYYNWCSAPGFGNGVPVQDGVIHIVNNYSSAPSSTSVTDYFLQYDGVLKISSDKVWLDLVDI